MLALATMPSTRMMTLPAAVTVVLPDAGRGAPTWAVTFAVTDVVAVGGAVTGGDLGALPAAVRLVAAAWPVGCAGDWAQACVAISAQLVIKVSLKRQGFTWAPAMGVTKMGESGRTSPVSSDGAAGS